jgi:monovalent cation:H+ antiporter-2, CPA2 family
MPQDHSIAKLLIELGATIVGLALLARIASRWSVSAIPLYLLAGLAFGKGGLAPLNLSQNFISVGAEMGVLLLLFMLGLEYSGQELRANLRMGLPGGVVDFFLNFPPGVIAGYLLGWNALASVLLGGVTYISSSGIIAKVLADLGRMSCPETPSLLSVLVIEDLVMAIYLPVVAVLLAGGGPARMAISVGVAVFVVAAVLWIALRYGQKLSDFASHESDEIVLLTTLGVVLLVAGFAQQFQVSAAIGAFLVGIAVSGPVAERAHRVIAPLRDLFAATFFFFFGLEVNPAALPAVWRVAALLALITSFTKIATGYWLTKDAVDPRAKWRAGMTLVARGEFSVVIAGLGVAIEPRLGTVAAAYVLLLAIAGPVLARLVK